MTPNMDAMFLQTENGYNDASSIITYNCLLSLFSEY